MQSRSFWSSTELRILLEDVVTARLRGVLEPKHGLGVEEVLFAVTPPLVLAPLQQPARQRFAAGERAMVMIERLAGDLRQADAADARGGLVEVFPDELFVQPDRLENLGPPITLNGADAHLGHHLDDPLLDRLAKAINGLVVVDAP